MRHTIKEALPKLFADPFTLAPIPTLIISDTHCPYQNKKLIMSAFKIAKERHVKQLIHAGDLIDAAEHNIQAKNELVPSIDTEIEHARSLLYTARMYFDSIVMIPGNHDGFTLKKLKITFPHLINTVVLDGKYTSNFLVTDYDYVFYGDYAVIGHLSSGYDPIGGKVAAQLAVKYNRHCLVGHDHLFGMVRAENGKLGISIGATFEHKRFWYKEKSYNTFPDSALGFVIIADGKISHFDEQLNERIYE